MISVLVLVNRKSYVAKLKDLQKCFKLFCGKRGIPYQTFARKILTVSFSTNNANTISKKLTWLQKMKFILSFQGFDCSHEQCRKNKNRMQPGSAGILESKIWKVIFQRKSFTMCHLSKLSNPSLSWDADFWLEYPTWQILTSKKNFEEVCAIKTLMKPPSCGNCMPLLKHGSGATVFSKQISNQLLVNCQVLYQCFFLTCQVLNNFFHSVSDI